MRLLKFFTGNRKVDLSSIKNAKLIPVNAPLKSFNTIIVTWFYIGLIGIAPGTLASLAAYPLFYFIISSSFITTLGALNAAFYGAAIVTFIIGMWSINIFQKKTNTFDHASVVIDEIAGMMLAFALSYTKLFKVSAAMIGAFGIDIKIYNFAFLLIFVLFRFFDIYKPFFISKIDENIKNSFGVMFDDSLAAVYTAITILILNKIF